MLAQTTPGSSKVDEGALCGHGQPQWLVALGWAGVVWYLVVTVVCLVGWVQIQKHYSRIARKSVSGTTLARAQVPHATIIRPVKGLEPYLYECLASSVHQDYPRDKLTVHLCVSSARDPALPILKRLVRDFPDSDVRIFIEDEDAGDDLGPNPKIRNMSRAYREAKGDIIWIIDSNVWVAKGVCGRMIDRLCGFSAQEKGGRRYKFVHHLPLVVDVDGGATVKDEETSGLLESYNGDMDLDTPGLAPQLRRRSWASILANGGGRLEELFLSSAHAKMYSAINTVLVAPCTVGKSSMFRKSHLDYLTSPAGLPPPRPYPRRPGIDFFSDNICEDHLIGDRLWKGKIFEEREKGERWGKHSIVLGDLAIQPISGMSVGSYFDRRVRWLRVRKFTVTLATLVEPGTESFLCSVYLAFGITIILPSHYPQYCSFLSSWAAFVLIWILSVVSWIALDWTVYLRLHSAKTIEVDEHTPPFARPLPSSSISRRPFIEWLCAWFGREALAFPIWAWAVYGGSRVVWRDRTFRVGMDMIVHEIAANNNGQFANGSTGRRTSLTRSSGSTSSHEDADIRRRSPSNVRNREQLD